MSRFTKKNIVLIVVLAASGVAAAVLLIYSAIVWISLLGKMDETNSARDKVSSLTKAKPAPGRKNEERIEGDIKIFEKASVYLRNSFVHHAYKGSSDEIDESRWREIFLQILCSKPQEYWMYFKVLISKSWGKRFARCRWRFIQRFPGLGKCRPCRMTYTSRRIISL